MRQFQFTSTESSVQATVVVDITDANTQLFTIMQIRGGKDNVFENRFPWKEGGVLYRAELRDWYEKNKDVFNEAYEYGDSLKVDFSKHFIQGTSTHTDNFTVNINGVKVWVFCDSQGNFYYDMPELASGKKIVEVSLSEFANQDSQIVTCEINDLYGNLHITNMYRALRKCTNLESCTLNFSTRWCDNFRNLFADDTKLVFDEKMIDDISLAEEDSLSNIFKGIANTSLDLSHWKNSKINAFNGFTNCKKLKSVVFGDFMKNVSNIRYFAQNCGLLESISLKNLIEVNIDNLEYVFDGCSSLELIDLEGINTKNASVSTSAFRNVKAGCTVKYNSSIFISDIAKQYATLNWVDLDE